MMNLVRTISLSLLFLLSGMLFGQTLTVVINPIVQVPVGSPFTVSGTVSHDPASAAIPAGTPVRVTIQVLDPSGNLVQVGSPIEDYAGFNAGRVFNFSQQFDMPWSEDDKWTPTALWNVSVSVSSSVSALVNATESFPLLISDLTLQVNGPTTAAPGEFVDLTGVVTNLAAVQTEPGIFFKVEAYIPNTNFTHSITFPPAGSWVAPNPWPIAPNIALAFTIPNFYIPPGTPDGPLQITVEVDDPDPIILGVPVFEVIHEQEDIANNSVTHTINIVSGTANLQPSTDFLINGGLEGTYQGNDAVRCTVSIRNVGTGPVVNGNAFDYRVFLSNDTTVSNDDFLLRQVDLGSTGLGNGLLVNESITLDWIQMLPDNFEGDYYVIADLNGALLNARTTPSLTLRSEDLVNIQVESTGEPLTGRASRPSSSNNGLTLAYEVFDGNISRLLLKNTLTTGTIEITSAFLQNPNGSSFAPKVSADGRFVVFHSFAQNLVVGDYNDYSDIFRYDVHEARLVKITETASGANANGGSYYPTISEDGSRIAFESHATNLDSNSTAVGKEILLWTENPLLRGAGSGSFKTISDGNADSFDASISGDGTRITFTTHATDLVAGETDENGNPDIVLWENGNYYYAGRAEDGSLPKNGKTTESSISSDGKVISFVSSARNMVSGKGIAHILIEDAGVGYPAGSTVQVNDVNGSGASVRISSLNPYGEVLSFSIDNPGRNYVNPTLAIVTPGMAPLPTRDAKAIPLLVNPEGDVFRITVDAVKSGGGSERISESPPLDGDAGSETGGNLGSREPSLSRDGTLVSYATRASNLQDLNVTSSDLRTFANHRFRPATAQALLHWGIGSVIITNPGSGYLGTGSVDIVDLSGSGSGAVATYSVLSNGQIGNITIVNSGSGYNLSSTILSIQNDPGNGFRCQIQGSPGVGLGANRTGGATIHRIEMIDSGIGYPSQLNSYLESPEILVDGDGADLDSDGKPDARLNPDRLFTASDGQVYLEQQIDITIKNRVGLIGSSLSIADANQSIIFSFASTPQGANVLGVDFDILGNVQTDSGLRNDLIASIKNFWGNPSDVFSGPLIENNSTGGNSFTLRVLNGSAVSDNLSSLQVFFRSNMLVGGSGYTRATPFITPSPSVIGFSEVQTGTSTLLAPNGRPVFDIQEDLLTDDIYYYDHNFSQNRRISVSKFGFPTNYLSQTTLPSHRFPSLSGNGRYVFFSSDAGGLGGLIFDTSNRIPVDNNNLRDIYKRDLRYIGGGDRTGVINDIQPTISINTDLFDKTNYILTHGQQMPVIVDAVSYNGYLNRAELYVDGVLESTISNTTGLQQAPPRFYSNFLPGTFTNTFPPTGTTATKARYILPFTPTREGFLSLEVVIHDSFGNQYRSNQKIDVKVEQPEPEVMSGAMRLNPDILGRYSIMILQRTDLFFTQTNIPVPSPIHGPFTESEIDFMKVTFDPIASTHNDAFFESDSPLNLRQLDDIYPQRLRVTRGSSLNASASFVSGYGKRSNLEKVIFYLNGDFLKEDNVPPYAVTFTPPLLADDNLTVLNSWSISAHAIPINNGRSFMIHKLGESYTEVVLPEAKLSFTDPKVVASGEIHDGDRVSLQVTVTGESESLKSLMDLDGNGSDNKRVHFVINGVPLTSVPGVPVFLPSGEITQVDFYAMLNADFAQFAEPDGSIEIQALGEMNMNNNYTPVYSSNTLKLRIKEPMPWLDEMSAGASIFRDLSESNMTNEEQNRMENLIKTHEDGVAKWVEQLTDRASFDNRITVLAAYHIATGEWHESYFDLEAAIERVDANSSSISGINRIKSYIDGILNSVRYEGKFGSVPYLVGSFEMSNTFNFDINRRSFVQQCLVNKYSYLENGYTPSFQQLFQGSKRMLSTWSSFEQTYWELPTITGAPALTGFDSPPRRDSLTANSYNAGECAVDFIYHLANETKMLGSTDGSASYIVYSENIRASIYRTATLMSLLWRSNAFPIDNKLVLQYSLLPFDQMIKSILNDPRYSSRFNLIWRDSQPVIQSNPHWKNESWFGDFYDKHFPWIYHQQLGWLYMAGVSPYQYWFYHQTLGWLWTGNKYYPQVFSNNEQNWIYLYPERNVYYSHGSQTTNNF